MTVKTMFITAFIILGVSIPGIILSTLLLKNKKRIRSILQGFFAMGLIFSFIGLITLIGINSDAISHGSYTTDITLSDMIESTKKSPIEDKVPDDYNDLKGKLIVYYRFDCPDCHFTYEPLMKYLKENAVDRNDIVFVSSRSNQGKKLMETYPIEEVPSMVYVYRNQSGYTDFVKKVIYDDEDGTAKLNITNLDRLLELKNNENTSLA